MTRNKKEEKANSKPVHFADEEPQAQNELEGSDRDVADASTSDEIVADSKNENMEEAEESHENSSNEENEVRIAEKALSGEAEAVSVAGDSEVLDDSDDVDSADSSDEDISASTKPTAGPMLAELIATRAELKRVETERNDLMERLARRQADFENYRKRVERERGETYQRMVGDVVSRLLPVMDNMRRALQAESMLEKNESAEFRHFLRGVELIYKQLNDALQELGVEPVPSVGQPFDPHVHEAVATEHSDEYEPDTVTQELLRGYRLGEKLLRPAMVKVSTR